MSNHTQEWKAILECFASTQCRCEETLQGRACRNYEIAHLKGHQFDLGFVAVKGGDFVSSFPDKIQSLLDRFQQELTLSMVALGKNRREWGNTLCHHAQLSGARKIYSNRTCLACLFRTPIHMLPCSHSVCEECAGDLGANMTSEAHTATLTRCPFGCSRSWASLELPQGRWTIRKKPIQAGVRILSLDGYVQLRVN